MSKYKCRYCGEDRSAGHMANKHPDILAKYHAYINDTRDKERAEKVHEKEVRFKWRRQIYGNRIG